MLLTFTNVRIKRSVIKPVNIRQAKDIIQQDDIYLYKGIPFSTFLPYLESEGH